VIVFSVLAFATAVAATAGPLQQGRDLPLVAAHTEPARPFVQRVGGLVRRRFGRAGDTVRDQRVGRVVVGSICGAVVSLPLGLVGAGIALLVDVRSRQRASRRQAADLASGLAEVIDLYGVALSGGSTVIAATGQVSRWLPGAYGDAFDRCLAEVATGREFADALESVPAVLGSQVRPLIAALVATERYGAPIAEGLRQLAADSRADQRRRAEAAARRLPVAMVFPLVVCVLPAFMLLTVVPVVADTLSSLELVGLG